MRCVVRTGNLYFYNFFLFGVFLLLKNSFLSIQAAFLFTAIIILKNYQAHCIFPICLCYMIDVIDPYEF